MKILNSLLLVLAFAVNAEARTIGTAYVEAKVTNMTERYIADGNGSYKLDQHSQSLDIEISGIGKTQRESKTENRVVGKDIKGHDIAKFEERGGSYYMVIDTKIDDTIDGHKIQLDAVYSLEVVFTQGTWADYQEGKTVELKLSRAGARELEKVMSENMLQGMDRGFKANMPSGVTVTSKVHKARLYQDVKYVMSKDSIFSSTADVRISMSFTLSQ